MNPILLVLLAVMSVASLVFSQSEVPRSSSRDFRPEGHLENIPLADSSIQQCYVFLTTAGVSYTVESSTDLSNWISQDEIYGLGNEYVVTMREYTPPPPPPPGTPPAIRPAPAINASIRLQRASGPEGGIVVAWPSRDHGGPIVVRIAGEMDLGWNQIPLFSNRFDGYYFFIWHPWHVVAPPTVNSPLGLKDSALLAALEASLPAMNQQVAESVFRSRNAPLPGPDLPGSKRFWRVKVDPDVDTDSDGSPDWAEFEIFTRGTGSMVPGVIGDAFNSDTNGDNIPDGQQLDADLDGTPDANDPDAADKTAFFPIGPVPRYALFPITNAVRPSSFDGPYQINDKGRVVYKTGTWCAGKWTPLIAPAGGSQGIAQPAHAFAINDNDVVLGNGNYQVGSAPEYFAPMIYYWKAPDAAPLPVKSSQALEQGYAGRFVGDYAYHGYAPRPVLSNDGRFSAVTKEWSQTSRGTFTTTVQGDDGTKRYENELRVSVWTLPTGASTVSTEAVGTGSNMMPFHKDPGLTWGYTSALDESGNETGTRKGKVFAPGTLPDLPFLPYNVFSTSNGTLALAPSHLDESPKLFANNTWQDSLSYKYAIDMADDGTAITNRDGATKLNLTAPILINGKWLDIARTTPDVPATWKDSPLKLTDTTPGGWILARTDGPDPTLHQHAVLLPIRIIESPPDPNFVEATGVDAYSIKSEDSGSAVSNKIWIMAPSGSGSTKVQLKSPINDKSPLELSADGIKFDNGPNITLAADNRKFDITANNSSNSGMEIPLTIKLGTVETVSRPIGVKVMKRRTIKVSVHPVGSLVEGKTTNEPDTVPTKAQLDEFLNKVYTPQINAVFDTTIVPLRNLEWDKATPADFGVQDPNNYISVGNGWLDTNGGDQYNEDTYIRDQLNDAAADINIYILGGGRIRTVLTWDNMIRTVKSIVLGMTRVKENTIFIDGDIGWYHGLIGNDTGMEQLRTIAHEIGHCLVGEGHADTEDSAVKLKGFNPTNLVQERLMVSGNLTRKPVAGCRLVKGEWDEAETWMKKFVDSPTP